jgi:hypothetical protein
MQCTNCGTELQPGATVCPSCEQRVVLTRKAVEPPRRRAAATSATADKPFVPQPADAAIIVDKRAATDRPAWFLPVLAVVIVAAIAAGVWFVSSAMKSSANTPELAATRMMEAYASYDARGMLDNVTRSSLTATDEATFEKQVVDSKVANKGLPVIKDIKVTKVTIDPKDPTKATVQLSEMILDTAKGTYVARTDTLTVLKQSDGRWLVKLF